MKQFSRKSILSFTALLFLSVQAFCQQVLSGTVRDSNGEPIPGAVVLLQNDRDKGTMTDISGRWSLKIDSPKPSEVVIEVSCLSYKTVTEKVGKRSKIDVVLEDNTEEIDEVVVVGYGAMRRSDLTGSLASVKVDENDAARSNSLDQLLQGAASGVEVINNSSAPDAGVSIRIRGITSLNGSSEPLYVVDGVIMTDAVSGDFTKEMSEESNGLMGLNPSDIASMEILKDASATAIYGADGANGVILITTKQGSRQKPVIRFQAGMDFQSISKRMPMLNFEEYVQFLEARTDSYSQTMLSRIFDDPYMHTGLRVTPTDWQEYSLHTVANKRWFLSVSGKPNTTSYSLSLGANIKDGIVRSTGVDNYTMRLNVDKTFTKRFVLGTKVNFAYVYSRSQQGANSDAVQASASMMRSMLSYPPLMMYVASELDDEEDEDGMASYSSPDRWIKYAKSLRKEYRVTPTIYAKYAIAPGVIFKSQLGADYRSSERLQWKGRTVSRSTGAIAGASNTLKYRWSLDNTLDFNKKFRAHSVSGTLGMTLGQDAVRSFDDSGTNILQEAIQMGSINTAYIASTTYGEVTNSRTSFFARAIWNYADRYVLTATYRMDGSSKFLGKNRFSGFPSLAAAWRVNKEPWFVVPQISLLKFRLGWGMVGNSSISAYRTYNMYSSSKFGNHINEAEYSAGIYQNNFPNADLKWETTRQWNMGVDLSFFKGRIALTADVYHKLTYDLLQTRQVPRASGYSTRWVNQGTILNKGLEFSGDFLVVKARNFEWNLSANISFNRNSIQSLGFAVDEKEIYLKEGERSMKRYYLGSNIASSTYLTQPGNIFIEGEPIGLYYGLKTQGIVQEGQTGTMVDGATQPQQPGQINYVDMNGDGVINNLDRTVIGDLNPKFTYGFRATFSLFRLTMSMNFDGAGGKQLLNANTAMLTDPSYQYATNMLRDAYFNAWTPENKSNKYLSLSGWTTSERNYVTDRYVEDASYLRLSTVSLSYKFPFSKKSKVLKGLTAGATCGNLLMLTKYSGWSPMVNSFGHSMTRMGIDIGSYPYARSYSFDLTFTF